MARKTQIFTTWSRSFVYSNPLFKGLDIYQLMGNVFLFITYTPVTIDFV